MNDETKSPEGTVEVPHHMAWVPRVKALEDNVLTLTADHKEMKSAHLAMQTSLVENTTITKKTSEDVGELLEVSSAVRGFIKVLKWVGAICIPIAAILGVASAIRTLSG